MKRRCKQTRLVLYAGMVMLMMGLGATGFAAPALAADKPNILVIFGDDVGMWNVGAYTNGMMGRTPNIDRIAKEELLKGKKIGGMTYKVYLDGYNNLDLWTGKSKKSARNRYFYYDESDLTGVRVGDWKMPFAVKEDGLWWDPLVYPRVPYLFSLRMDPMELFDPHSPEWGYMGRKIFTEKL